MDPNKLEKSPLGKETQYFEIYDALLLYPIPRDSKRAELEVPENLPFHGQDVWNAYELSWLNPKGKPQVAYGVFSLPCTSKYIVESKSLKLYLNSLNQTKFASLEEVEQIIRTDLSKVSQSEVEVTLFPPSKWNTIPINEFEGECIDHADITVEKYQPDPGLLEVNEELTEETLTSNLLKSNCPVTGQPDWASIQIHYQGPKINHESLLKYLISFRNFNEFHEQCVERIFMDLSRHCNPTKLSVFAKYTRRGGLDINPFRSNFELLPQHTRNFRQ